MAVLVREARPEADAEVLSEAILAPLAADLYRHLRESGVSAGRVRAVVRELAGRAVAPDAGLDGPSR